MRYVLVVQVHLSSSFLFFLFVDVINKKRAELEIVPFIMFKKWVIRYVKYNSCNSIGSVRNVIFSGGSYPQ